MRYMISFSLRSYIRFSNMISRYVFLKLRRHRLLSVVSRTLSSKVPASPAITLDIEQDQKVIVDKNTLSLLERLSLVKCDTVEGVKVLEDSITFANKILHINTDNVEPLYSVLEQQNLSLRIDAITQGNCQKDILKNASVKDDDYFVAPPGNIPLNEVNDENVKKHKNEN